MASPKYLLRVLSKPTKVDEDLWQKWYTTEHVPDVVNSGLTAKGALFRAHNEFALQTKTVADSKQTKLHSVELSHFNELPDDKTFVAVYPTHLLKPLEDRIFSEGVRHESELLPGKETRPCAEWDVRVYEKIQDYDPDNLGDVISPYVLHVQNEPSDEQDYHDFYEKEHLDMLHKVPGYRKSQRYKLVDRPNAAEDTPTFMVIHEFEHLDALDGPELREADASPWVHKVFGNAKAVNVRGWKRVFSLGYDNS